MGATKCKNRFCNLWRSYKPTCCAKLSPRVEHCPESCRYDEFVAGLTAPTEHCWRVANSKQQPSNSACEIVYESSR